MELIRINETEYLSNITWSSIVAFKDVSKKFAQLTSENSEAKYGLVCKFQNNAVIGLIENNKKTKQLSASVYLANANAVEYSSLLQESDDKSLAWICVQKVSGGKYWVGSALNGLPFSEDKTVPDYEVKNLVSDVLTSLKLQSSTECIVTVFVEDEDLNTALNKDLYEHENVSFSNKSFEDIVDGVKYQAIYKQKTSVKTLAVFLLGFIGVGAACYFAYDWYETQQRESSEAFLEGQRQMDKEQLLKKQKEYENQKLEAIEKAKELAKTKLNEKLTFSPINSVLKNWNETLANENTMIQGWYKTEIKCEIDNKIRKTFCNYKLVRNPSGNVGTVKDIADYYRTRGNEIVIDDSGDEIVAKYINNNELMLEDGDYSSLAGFDFESFKYKNLSELQLMALNGFEKEVKKPILITTKIELPKPPQGIKQDMNLEDLNLGIAEGGVLIKGKELFRLQGLAKRLERLEKPFKIETLEIKSNGNSTATGTYEWVVKGSYFIEDEKHKGGNFDKIKIPKSEINNK